MKKTVLILNTSHNDVRLILALKEMNFHVIATGSHPGLAGEKYVDEYIQQDYSNKEEMLQLARNLKIDAICACCNDLGVITAAYVAEQLGLPGHDTYENTLIMHHKDRFKQFAKENGINTPFAEYFSTEADAIQWAISKAEYPIIVKPTDLSAGRGVSKADAYSEAVVAIQNAFSHSRIKKIVIEPYIEGTQHACCTFIMNKKVVAYCTNNEYSFVNPYRVEIDTYPAENFESVKSILINEAEKMATILNLKDGILSMQYRLKDGKPHIIEAMRRVLGNLYMIPAEKLTGLNWDYWEARTHCGLDCSDFPVNPELKGFYAYRTIMGCKNGFVKKLVIPESFKKYIFDECILWNPNIPINDYMSEPLAFIFFKFDSKEEMNQVILDQYNCIYAEY
jgi:biotin carboxylase